MISGHRKMISPVESTKNESANHYRERSAVRDSFLSNLGTVVEENHLTKSNNSDLSNEDSPLEQASREQSETPTLNPIQEITSALCPREVMKARIQYHFMNPIKKFRARRRKPWKLLLQIVKIVLVTVQICLFGFDRFSLVTFLENNHLALKHLFLKDFKNVQQGVEVYTRSQLYNYLHYAHEQYYQIRDVALGSYGYTNMVNGSEPPPMRLCYSYYAAGGIENNTYIFNPVVQQDCINLKPTFHHEHMTIKNDTFNLGRLRDVQMIFSLKTINLKDVKAWDRPNCYLFDIQIFFDNLKHDGRMPVQLLMNNTLSECKKGEIKGSSQLTTDIIKETLVVFDAIVIFICTVSLFLCGRSVYRSLKLAMKAAKFFKEDELLENFTFWDYQEFVSLWFLLLMISDCLTIIGSVYKVAIDQRDSDYFNVCSLFLGIAVLLVWIGLLRFLSYFKNYNILLVTLKLATPSIIRFFVCASLLFAGFMFCGWVVLGPFHRKFRTLTVTAECLYSMINGDDLFNTYVELTPRTPSLTWIFSKVYLYTFISLFIYVVLSLFIGIIGDTYERIRDLHHLPESKIKKFIHEPANHGRSVQHRDSVQQTAPIVSETLATAQTRGVNGKHGTNLSTSSQDPFMNMISVESTGAE